jgi:DNA polymerase III epsilon subunit-like protein
MYRTFFIKWNRAQLSAAYRFYCNKTHEGAHGAEADALATYEILEAQTEKYTTLGNNIDSILKARSGKKRSWILRAGFILEKRRGSF